MGRGAQRGTLVVCLAAGCLWPAGARAQGSAHLGGYVKNYSVVFDLPEAQQQLTGSSGSLLGSFSNRLRLQGAARTSTRLRFEAAYDLRPRVQDPALLVQDVFRVESGPLVYRVDDLDLTLYPSPVDFTSSLIIYQNLDRLQMVWSPEPFDLYVGRQAIAWGAARVVNPTDVLAPFQYNDLDVEDRVGIDAVRFRVPVGNLNEIDAGYVPGRDFEIDDAAFFLRGRVFLDPQDVSALVLAFRRHLLVGFDIARPIGGAGAWLEAAYAWMNTFRPDSTGMGPSYLRLSTGLDYNFSGDIYGYIEYHFNGAGTLNSDQYLDQFVTTPYREAAVYLVGRHYLTPGIIWTVSPLWSITANLLTNLHDPSVFASSSVEYNIAENVYIGGGAYLGLGKPSNVQIGTGFPPSVDLQAGSEFGTYANFYYFSFRFYF